MAALHFALFMCVLVVSVLAGYAMGGDASPQSLVSGTLAVSGVLAFFISPLTAFLALRAGSIAGMKTDVAFCRAVSAASFIIFAAAYSAFFALIFLLQAATVLLADLQEYGYGFGGLMAGYPIFGIPLFGGKIMALAVGDIAGYLWLLLFVKPDAGRLKKAAAYSVVFALGLLLFEIGAESVREYAAGIALPVVPEPSMAYDMLRSFVFAFPILYHVAGRKFDMEAGWFFGGLHFGAAALIEINAMLGGSTQFPQDYGMSALVISSRLVALCLLYGLSRTKDISI